MLPHITSLAIQAEHCISRCAKITTAWCRVLNDQQFATANDTYDYSYGQGADTFGLLRRPTGWRGPT